MEQEKSSSQKQQEIEQVPSLSVVEEQAAYHAEAHRRMSNGAPPDPATGLPARGFDAWSASGALPGVVTPDLQGPQPPLGFGVVPVPSGFQEGNANTLDIFHNPHRPGQK